MRLVNLKHYREREGLSQDNLAEKSGVSGGAISRIENGREAHVSTARKLAEALGVRPGDLMESAATAEVGR